MRIFKNQRGDTIMEVLIAVAVLSLILTVSLALANRNTQGNRQAQERGEATKHTESQIELLKSYLATTNNPVLPSSGNFCMNNDGTPTEAIDGIPDIVQPEALSETFEAFNNPALADCKKGEFFHTYINREGNTFTAHTRWYKVAGRGVDEATMVHRLYPDVAGVGGNLGTGTTGCMANHYMNSLGGCVPCTIAGTGSSGGTATSCTQLASTMRVYVRKINPASGNITPSCSATSSSDKSGITVTLTRAGFSVPGQTDATSLITFNGLPVGVDHSVTVSAPSNYEVCPPASRTVNSGGPGPAVGVGYTSTVIPEFKVRPICTETVTPHYNSVPQYRTDYYWVWQHYPQSPLQNLGRVPYPVFGSGPNTFGSSAPPAANWAGWTAYEPYHVHTNHGHYFYNRFVSEQRSSRVLTGYTSEYSHSTTTRSCPS